MLLLYFTDYVCSGLSCIFFVSGLIDTSELPSTPTNHLHKLYFFKIVSYYRLAIAFPLQY